MAGVFFLGIYCCCCCYIIPGFIWLILLMVSHFYISLTENETYVGLLWWLRLVYYCFENILKAHYFVIINFIWYVLPYMIIIYVIDRFKDNILIKINDLKRMQREMMIEKNSPKLSFYAERLQIMKMTLFYLFGFLIALRTVSYVIFDDNFVMGAITYFYMAFFMAILMMRDAKDIIDLVAYNSNRQSDMRKIFNYNVFLIFVCTFIINDVLHLITGKNYFY